MLRFTRSLSFHIVLIVLLLIIGILVGIAAHNVAVGILAVAMGFVAYFIFLMVKGILEE